MPAENTPANPLSLPTLAEEEAAAALAATQNPPQDPAPTDDPPAGDEKVGEQVRDKLAGFWDNHLHEGPSLKPPADEDPNRHDAERAKDRPPPKEKADEAPKDETPPDDGETKPAKADTKPARTTTKAPKAPKEQQPPKPEVDPLKIAEATGRAIVSGLHAAAAPPPAPSAPAVPADPFANLPEEFSEESEVYREMVKLNPAKYKDLATRLQDYAKKEEEYIKGWEDDNQGREFDADDVAHNDFYARIAPKFEKRDFEKAKESVIERRTEERVLARMEPRLRAFENERKLAELQPLTESHLKGITQDVIGAIFPDENNRPDVATLEKTDPIAADAIQQTRQMVEPWVGGALRYFRGIDPFDSRNPVHRMVAGEIERLTTQLMAKPREERLNEGRDLTTIDRYLQMSPEEQKKHWYVWEEEFLWALGGSAMKTAAQLYEEQKGRFQRYSKWSGNGQPAPTDTPPKPAPDKPKPDSRASDSPPSPSVTGRSSLVNDGGGNAPKPKSGSDLFWESYLKR